MKSSEDNFKDIGQALLPVLPDGWQKVCLYACLDDFGYEMFFYCFIKGKKKPVQCYDLAPYGIKEEAVNEVFDSLNNMLQPMREESKKSSKGAWTNCTFTLLADGTSNMDFDYTDLLECEYEYREAWKKKYLA